MLHTQNENLQAQRAWNTNARFWDERMADGNDFFTVSRSAYSLGSRSGGRSHAGDGTHGAGQPKSRGSCARRSSRRRTSVAPVSAWPDDHTRVPAQAPTGNVVNLRPNTRCTRHPLVQPCAAAGERWTLGRQERRRRRSSSIVRSGVDLPRGLHQAAARGSATRRHHLQCPNMGTSPRQGWRALPHG
jgi:hypothetical protein